MLATETARLATGAQTPLAGPPPAIGALRIGPIEVWPPVVLAPMAGITNAPFRTLCRTYGAGLYVSEMITSQALVEGSTKTRELIRFDPSESPRSLQLYGVDPRVVGRAVAQLVEARHVDHLDLNFGCPVPKVTRRGGGSALPYRRPLLRAVLRAAVRAAGPVPVTMKMRTGIDERHLTYLDAGRIAQDEGIAAVALHGRTAAQHYAGRADWDAIARLKAALDIPVLGNGDIWEAADALRMMAQTGCDGVVVGRGCLGRPWLFRDLAEAYAGRPQVSRPTLREVAAVMRRHAELLAAWMGEEKGVRDFRKHVAAYTKGFAVGPDLRGRLARVSTLAELGSTLAALDLDQPFPEAVLGAPRGRTSGQPRVALPEGWLDDPDSAAVPFGAELGVSGG